MGVIACEVIELELDSLKNIPQIANVIYLEAALHCRPERMKEIVKEQINTLAQNSRRHIPGLRLLPFSARD